ncbi:MAG TPA: hypothetical protein VKR56_13585 [Candidatus Cybelea sp.]|nr:hypothetical protein [Candidatus Cybelea sp.]
MYVQPLEGSLGPNSLSSLAGNAQEGPLFEGAAAPAAGDNISRFVPPWLNDGAAASPYGEASYNNPSLQGLFGPLMGMLAQLMTMLQSMMGYGGCTSPYGGNGGCGSPYAGNGSCAPRNGEHFFQNASGSSDGDPHLSFNGAKWNNMASQPDLLNSRSFQGGYRVSTQVTPPNGKGVTWNQSATVSLNHGATTITMNNNGEPSITSYGQPLSIARGQTLELGDGESVKCEQDGALRVTAQNARGGQISTTLSVRGKGVDVDVTAHDVDLAGALVNGDEAQPGPGPLPGPFPMPWPGPFPQPGPIPEPYTFAPSSSVVQPVAFPDE